MFDPTPQPIELQQLFPGDGEMARRMREHDWSQTSLGAPQGWPLSLQTALRLMLSSRYPMFLWWGRELVNFYNDAYIDVLGARHPMALGMRAPQVWHEIWDVLGPQALQVLDQGASTWNDRVLLVMQRRGYTEETYFTFSYSPAFDDAGAVVGVFCVCTEDTYRVLSDRRLQTLGTLASALRHSREAEAACRRATEALGGNPHDLPFALIYLQRGDGSAHLAGHVGVAAGAPCAPLAVAAHAVDAPWPFAELARSGAAQQVVDLQASCGPVQAGPWPQPVASALLQPLVVPNAPAPAGWLVAGVNPLRPLDAEQADWLALVAAQIGAAITDARAFEAEQERARQLAEIDRAKTAFFTNVSHEFRTPLTLMLGPLGDLHGLLEAGPQRELAATAQRNAQRLLKLVNTLLDFARVEGGRADAAFEPVDLAAATADLASTFRAACERAGLSLVVDCPPLPQPVFVDRGQWEKIVLNLLSNAFKFTLEGQIEVALHEVAEGREAELTVRDSGVGIPAEELPKLFNRFQRIAGQRGRSFEGSGIGLALVQELVKLHGGRIAVASREGDGATFSVRLPFGAAHLPAERVRHAPASATASASNASQAAAFVGEALHWLPQDAAAQEIDTGFGALDVAMPADVALAGAPRILVADDNADLRAYLARLLGARYHVITAEHGEAALALALADPPDLVLSDVMMPRLDGFGLIERLRGDARTRTLPVILLSARAGEEARVEGLARGADDYLVKPFPARELLARVGAHLAAARIRREADAARRESEQQLRLALAASRAGAWSWRPERGETEWSEELFVLFGVDPQEADKVGASLERVHRDDIDALQQRMAEQMQHNGEIDVEYRIVHPQQGVRWCNTRGRRVEPDRVLGLTFDITERKAADAALLESELRFRNMADTAPAVLWLTDTGNALTFISRGWFNFTGQDEDAAYRGGFGWTEMVHEDDRDASVKTFVDAVSAREPFEREYRLRRTDGAWRWAMDSARPRFDAGGNWLGYIGSVIDVHEHTQAREALRQTDRRKDEFLAMLAHELRNPLAPIRNGLSLLRIAGTQAHAGSVHAMIERQVDHMVRLVDDLMEASRISRGKLDLKREIVDINDVLRAAVETSGPAIDRARHQLHLVLPSEPLPVDGDALRLAQVFTNVLNNAAKYSDDGGRIELTARREGNEVRVAVRDSGIGLTPEQLPQLFEIFAQLDSGRTRAQGGLGIGLSLARRLVQMHGGRIEAASEGPGNGSTFTVWLPLAPGAVAAAALPAAAAGLNARRVLVVDDNHHAADSLGVLLRFLGAEVRVEHSGAAALRAVHEWRPAVVLLDLGMPGIDGFEVARRLRAWKGLQGLKLIALTGWGQEADRQRTQDEGFDHHLIKPVEINVLQNLLATLQDGAATRPQPRS